MRYSIYTLSNPLNGEIFYVGKTINIKTRFKSHLNIKDADNEMKNRIIEFILHNSAMPIIQELDYIDCIYREDEDEVHELEMYWIWQMKAWGFPLCNIEGIKKPPKYRRRYSHVLKESGFEVTLRYIRRRWRKIYRLYQEINGYSHLMPEEVKLLNNSLIDSWNIFLNEVGKILSISFDTEKDLSFLKQQPYKAFEHLLIEGDDDRPFSEKKIA